MDVVTGFKLQVVVEFFLNSHILQVSPVSMHTHEHVFTFTKMQFCGKVQSFWCDGFL